jgi:hypothetical protein
VTRVSLRGLLVLVAIPLTLTACSPTARLELRFVASVPLDPALFQLTGKTCPPGPVAAPAPTAAIALAKASLRSDDSEWQQVNAEPPGLHVVTAFRGSHCAVRVTGHYDTNRDGLVNAGDLAATSPVVEVFDRGVFRENMTTGPVVRLTPIP